MEIKGISAEAIRELARILDDTNLTELEIEGEGTRVKVARQLPAANPAPIMQALPQLPPAPQPESAVLLPSSNTNPSENSQPISKDDKNSVKSPMVGTVYLSPEPGSEQFIKVGDTVSEGQVCMIISAMKMMNQIAAPKSGIVTKIYVANEEPVEFGTQLFSIK